MTKERSLINGHSRSSAIDRRSTLRQRASAERDRIVLHAPSPPSTPKENISTTSQGPSQSQSLSQFQLDLKERLRQEQVTQCLREAVETIRGERDMMLQRAKKIDTRIKELRAEFDLRNRP